MSEERASVVVIAVEAADQPEVCALLSQSDAYMASLYPAESNHLADVAALCAPNVRFLVARRGIGVMGCGALVLGAPGEAEIKRMSVVTEARGHRIGRQILAALKEIARGESVRVIRLETGVLPAQPAQHLLREVDWVTGRGLAPRLHSVGEQG